jgi:FHS family Na+ dependent glucose MFS transporter 1
MTAASLTVSTQTERSSGWNLTALYFASFIALGLTTGSLGPTLPSLAEQSNSNISTMSYLFTFRSLGYVCGSVRSGKLFDKHSANVVMGMLILISATALALIPLSANLVVLFVLMLALGVAEAGIDVGANTLLIRVHQDRVGPFMNAMHACFGIGALSAPLIVAKVISFGARPNQTYFVLALLLIPIAFLALSSRSPRAVNNAANEFRHETNKQSLILLVIFLFLYVGAEVGFAGWVFSYAIKANLASATAAAYLTSLFWGSLTAGRVLMIPLTTRAKPEVIIGLSLVAAVLSLSVMLFPSHSIALLTVATAALGLSIASIFPGTLSFAGKRMNMTGRVTGWFVVGASLGATVLPLVIGQLFVVGPGSTILVPLVALTLAGGVFAALNRNLE